MPAQVSVCIFPEITSYALNLVCPFTGFDVSDWVPNEATFAEIGTRGELTVTSGGVTRAGLALDPLQSYRLGLSLLSVTSSLVNVSVQGQNSSLVAPFQLSDHPETLYVEFQPDSEDAVIGVQLDPLGDGEEFTMFAAQIQPTCQGMSTGLH